jgi:hypothetical protein
MNDKKNYRKTYLNIIIEGERTPMMMYLLYFIIISTNDQWSRSMLNVMNWALCQVHTQ